MKKLSNAEAELKKALLIKNECTSISLLVYWIWTPSIQTISPIIKYNVISQQTFLVFQDVFKTSWRRLQCNTFRLPRPLEDVLKTPFRRICHTSCKTKKCCTEDVLNASSRRLQYVFTKMNVCWDRSNWGTLRPCQTSTVELFCQNL